MRIKIHTKTKSVTRGLRVGELLFFVAIFSSLFLGTSSAKAAFNESINYQGKLTDGNAIPVSDGAYDIVFKLYDAAAGGSTVWNESLTSSNLWTETVSTTITRNAAGCGGSGFTSIVYATGTNEASIAIGQTIWNTTLKESAVVTDITTGTNTLCVSNPYSSWANSDDLTNRVYIKSGLFSVMLGKYESLSSVDFNQTLYLGVLVGNDSEMVPRKMIGAVPAAFTAKTLNNNGSAAIATNDGATLNIGNTTGAVTMNSGGVSAWTNTAGNLTISTATSGILTLNSAGSLDLTGASASSFATTAGNITLQSAGSSTVGTVQIGAGGVGSITPDFFGLDVKSDTGDPAGGFEGAMYYNTFDNKFRCYQNAGWTDCISAGGSTTLQNSYDQTNGNTIVSTSGKNIALTLEEVDTPTSFAIENQDTSGINAEYINNSITSGTLANALTIDNTGAGTITNAINILETAGTITTGINIGNNVGTGISIGTGATTGIFVGSGGVTIAAGALNVNSDEIISDGSTLTINAGGIVDIQDILNADSITSDAGVSIASGGSYTGAGAVTLSSASASALTIDSGTTGNLDIGTGANAKIITLGNSTGATVVNINSGTGGISFQAAGTGTTDTIQIGEGGSGSSTPDILALDVKSDSGDPVGFEGAMYYNNNINKFRCYQDTAWTDCIGAGGGSGGDNISINGTSITDADFDNVTPASPMGGVNMKWQRDSSTPNNVSAYFDFADYDGAFKKKPTYASDFISGTAVAYNLPFVGAGISSGTVTAPLAAAIDSDHPGIMRLRSNTTANGGYRYQAYADSIRFKGGEIFNAVLYHENIDTTIVRMGFNDNTTYADAVDGCYFEVPTTGVVIGKCSNDSTRTSTTGSYTISTGTWYSYRVTLNSDATLATFEIFDSNGNSLWTSNNTVSSNIPTAAGRETTAGIIATESSTTATYMVDLDYMSFSLGTASPLAR